MVLSTDEKVAPGGWEPDERFDAESMIAHVGAGKVLELGSHALDQQLTKPRAAQNNCAAACEAVGSRHRRYHCHECYDLR